MELALFVWVMFGMAGFVMSIIALTKISGLRKENALMQQQLNFLTMQATGQLSADDLQSFGDSGVSVPRV